MNLVLQVGFNTDLADGVPTGAPYTLKRLEAFRPLVPRAVASQPLQVSCCTTKICLNNFIVMCNRSPSKEVLK